MAELTKEWLQKTIVELEEERDAVPGVVNEDATMALAAMKLALASLEVEPVAYMYKDNLHADARFSLHTRFGNWSQEDINEYEITEIPLYTAPPAPVSVPDAIHSQGEKSASDDYYALGWNACRAAMLQGAEPVTTAYKLPFEQWLSQQTGTIDVECGCVMTEVFFHWLRVAYEAGNSPQCREISNSSTNNFRENAETSTKCWCRTCRPVTFADSHFVVCPECGNKRCPHANDHRHACTGSNEPGQEGSAYPAAPQQEVK
ncbi:hypothetical protein SJZ88_10300 [Enterobacter hormaechei]|uniref:hypothetical protein n=1 Tax=Enterobacter hormaechei TaxID=158836 RepID=UPI0029DBB833|nr:hypothetical protein [Enterobacter hormaechei]MDX7045228.1 hypothetical protein [Enterobacter hormaechei]